MYKIDAVSYSEMLKNVCDMGLENWRLTGVRLASWLKAFSLGGDVMIFP